MADEFAYDVFLSHSAKDKATVRPIAERLRQDGLKVWLDEGEIKPGDSIPAKIEEGLEHSRVLVLCMSANAFGSDWAQLESQTFRFRDPLNKERRFIPVRLDDAPIRGSLTQFLCINWLPADREREYPSLLEACRVPGRPAQLTIEQERLLGAILSLGHTAWVRSVAWSPDGQHALSASHDQTVRLWEVRSGRCLRVFEGHTDGVWSVAWSWDGHRALSGSDDKTVRLWEVPSGRCLGVFEGHTDSVWSVAWSPDGHHALSGSADQTVRLWEVQSGRCLGVFEGHTGGVNGVAWSPDGQRALSGSADQTVRLWEVPSGRCLGVFEGHTGGVNGVAWSRDGHHALSGSDDQTVWLWEVPSGRCLGVFEGHTDSVLSVAWSPDGRHALSGSDDQTVRLWEVPSGRCLRVFEGHTDSVLSVAWSSDGQHALSGSDDKTVRLWEVPSGRCLGVFEGHTDSVLSVAWSPDGRQALSGSEDKTVRLWEVPSGRCLGVFEGHTASVWSVAWSPDGRQALSGSEDNTVRLWEVPSGRCLRVFEGHTAWVGSVAWRPDGQQALSGSDDNTVRLWEVRSGRCLRVFEGHAAWVRSVAWSADGQHALSGSEDQTVRLWEVRSGRCLRVFEGHTARVRSVAWSADGQHALSGSADQTMQLWEVQSGRCLQVFEGHTDRVESVAWSADGQHALSGSADQTVRLWEVRSGRCLRVFEGHTAGVGSVAWSADGHLALSGAWNGVARVWSLSELLVEARTPEAPAPAVHGVLDQVQYTNAKVLLVGDTSSGKTGLAHRLTTGQWRPTDGSTVGAWCTQWPLAGVGGAEGLEREVWLWDFGGQADQRLVHQLYMDRAALILLLFDADKEDVLPGLREWQAALRRCVGPETRQFLVAGRTDTGFQASRAKVQDFARKNRFGYFETSAKEGTGCEELGQAIKEGIAWERMEKRTSPRIFKLVKDQILKLRDEGQVLHTFKELREELWRRLPEEPRFGDETLRTVIGLLDGPGVVKELDYGTYVLLQPEWINAYAQAVIRTLRQDPSELGCLPLRSIAEGKLLFQTVGVDGSIVDMKRLPEAEERVVLREMERQLEERGLCLRQGDKLVFPSHCGRDRPATVEYPVCVSYRVKGYLDDIYATLVVKLADSESFKLNQLWRAAADFETLAGRHHIGIKLTREAADSGDISVCFAPGVTKQEQVIFANYIHAHLVGRCEKVQRLRCYVCPNCGTPKGNPEALMKKLLTKKRQATVECDACEQRFGLWDDLEILFASDEVRKQVEGLQALDAVRLDSRRKGKLLALEVGSRITSADQKCFEIPATEDEGIDMELEFTDDDGRGTGRRLYLQLKCGNSHLEKRKGGTEVFPIKEQRWVDYWLKQPHPVMLVIGTFAEEDERSVGKEKLEFDDVRWMEISSCLKRESRNGTKPVKHIEFQGERLDMASVHRWRKWALGQESPQARRELGADRG